MICGSRYNSNSHQPLRVYVRLYTRSHRELPGGKEMKALAIVKLKPHDVWAGAAFKMCSENTRGKFLMTRCHFLLSGAAPGCTHRSCASERRWSASCHLHRKAERFEVGMELLATFVTTFLFTFCLGSLPVRALKSQLFTRRGGSPSSSIPVSYKTLYFDQKVSIKLT